MNSFKFTVHYKFIWDKRRQLRLSRVFNALLPHIQYNTIQYNTSLFNRRHSSEHSKLWPIAETMDTWHECMLGKSSNRPSMENKKLNVDDDFGLTTSLTNTVFTHCFLTPLFNAITHLMCVYIFNVLYLFIRGFNAFNIRLAKDGLLSFILTELEILIIFCFKLIIIILHCHHFVILCIMLNTDCSITLYSTFVI